MKPRQLSPAVFVALLLAILVAAAGPAVVRADTIYYKRADAPGIHTVAGTIVRETDSRVEITTDDGRTVSIAHDDVFEIIRDTSSAETGTAPTDLREEFPAASALASRSTFGDTDSPAPVACHYGFKGGLSIANVRADPQELEEGGSLRGYAFGMWWGVPLWHRLTLQAEALFSMKGDAESAAGYTASTHLGYIDVPVLAKIAFLPDARAHPSLFAGPSLAINVSAHSKLEGEGSDVDVDVKDQVGRFDLGLVVGGGVEFETGGRTLGVDVRYSRGLSDVNDGANGSGRNDLIAVMGSIGLQ